MQSHAVPCSAMLVLSTPPPAEAFGPACNRCLDGHGLATANGCKTPPPNTSPNRKSHKGNAAAGTRIRLASWLPGIKPIGQLTPQLEGTVRLLWPRPGCSSLSFHSRSPCCAVEPQILQGTSAQRSTRNPETQVATKSGAVPDSHLGDSVSQEQSVTLASPYVKKSTKLRPRP